MTTNYTGRLAPSPTGYLHLGHARTFATAHQRAKNGTLLLRIDDLDQDRTRQQYIDAALEDLNWLGLNYQPPPIHQSQRHELYFAAFQKLAAQGWLYPCTCSRRDLATIAAAPHENADDEPIYPGTCRPGTCRPANHTPASITSSENQNWRFRIPREQNIRFNDLNLGPQKFVAAPEVSDFWDFLIWRKDNTPSYQLACAVDDAQLNITEVVRGADLLKSTARQILILRALSLPIPAYFHTALITDSTGQRLAKRHDALAIRTLRQRGLTPAQILHAPISTLL